MWSVIPYRKTDSNASLRIVLKRIVNYELNIFIREVLVGGLKFLWTNLKDNKGSEFRMVMIATILLHTTYSNLQDIFLIDYFLPIICAFYETCNDPLKPALMIVAIVNKVRQIK